MISCFLLNLQKLWKTKRHEHYLSCLFDVLKDKISGDELHLRHEHVHELIRLQ